MKPQEVRDLRSRLDLNQKELAQIVGVTPMAISHWERGNRVPDQRAQAILRKLQERTEKEGRSVAESLLTIAGAAGFVMVLDKLFGDE